MSRIRIVGGTITKNSSGNHYMYSDGNITFNATGFIHETAESHTYGFPINAPKPELPAKCIVHFRPKKNWLGEDYGFDWMRIGDSNLINGQTTFGDNNYKNIVAKQYTDNTFGTLVTDRNECYGIFKNDQILYNKLTNIYDAHNIPWKEIDDGTGNCVPEQYYCSWLSMYPNTKATISLIIDVEEEPDLLRFEDNKYFTITPKEIIIKGKGKKALANHITIECLQEFNSDQNIIINAIKEDENCVEQKLLAGKLNVWANNSAKQKRAKVLLVEVLTPDFSDPLKIKKGNLLGQKELFENYLKQALIETDVAITQVDVSADPKFQTGGHYVANSQIVSHYPAGSYPTGFLALENYLYDKIKTNLKTIDPTSENKYDDYYKAFYFGESGGQLKSNGMISGLNGYATGKNVVLFLTKNDQTAAHEFLHSFNLPHSFTNEEADSDAIFTYRYATTENILDYSHHIPQTRYSLWKWQWQKANQSLI
ncbi:hypothetical protein SAMN02927916_2296 [Flavobacterium anhuiense]|uniref:Uncharacterized protein n=1 Tax=Flavobacterium anhuiense TaxID=459526 RepID=A0ABY0LQ86_9FLAO|nr:hypothetical protein [Flavobacterium anhuiense]SCY49484.1 hypothetical protein SAMN02927916_2296 [Flavobacterium anhuiense]